MTLDIIDIEWEISSYDLIRIFNYLFYLKDTHEKDAKN